MFASISDVFRLVKQSPEVLSFNVETNLILFDGWMSLLLLTCIAGLKK